MGTRSVGPSLRLSLVAGLLLLGAAGVVLLAPADVARLSSSANTAGPGGGNPSAPGPGPAPLPAPPNGTLTPTQCNRVSSPTPSAVLVPTGNPAVTAKSGDVLGVAMDWAIARQSTAGAAETVYLPSLYATFPLANGSFQTVYFAPQNVALKGIGWANASSLHGSLPIGQTTTYAAKSALLSSQKIAAMGSEPYGGLTAEFSWRWTLTSGTTLVASSNWTQATSVSQYPTSLPSVFQPAPYVSLGNHTPNPATIGANWTADLGGHVGGAYFFLELETPGTGQVFQSQGQTAPGGAAQFQVHIVLLNYNHYLSPGTYLAHIHDSCGAMLYSASVNAVFAKSATVTLYLQPSGCGSISLGGSKYTSGQSATLKPTTRAYGFSYTGCPGRSFKNWFGTGGVHLQSAGKLLVSASGTFTVQFT